MDRGLKRDETINAEHRWGNMIASERVIYVYKNIADLSREKKRKKNEKEKKTTMNGKR